METQFTQNSIADYLINLSLNAKKLWDFQQNPELALSLAGFSTQEKAVFLSNNPQEIYSAVGLGDKDNIHAALVIVAIVVVNYQCN